eukprot:CAMPEP_0114994890 /NCGR_PEP_ID=MMETSP0216-20121206/13402_1 /TAXON_ID=223996 /ORGANISM="Protocruzia adherens, Strain Boccale" /LENGTH=288 /DNA_ID=CAMNT_0002358825 /DNA_START=22 /DNA_END=888 /DNA_ORIENTATION=+
MADLDKWNSEEIILWAYCMKLPLEFLGALREGAMKGTDIKDLSGVKLEAMGVSNPNERKLILDEISNLKHYGPSPEIKSQLSYITSKERFHYENSELHCPTKLLQKGSDELKEFNIIPGETGWTEAMITYQTLGSYQSIFIADFDKLAEVFHPKNRENWDIELKTINKKGMEEEKQLEEEKRKSAGIQAVEKLNAARYASRADKLAFINARRQNIVREESKQPNSDDSSSDLEVITFNNTAVAVKGNNDQFVEEEKQETVKVNHASEEEKEEEVLFTVRTRRKTIPSK